MENKYRFKKTQLELFRISRMRTGTGQPSSIDTFKNKLQSGKYEHFEKVDFQPTQECLFNPILQF